MAGKVTPTLKVLMEIRDEVRRTNERVDKLGDRDRPPAQTMRTG